MDKEQRLAERAQELQKRLSRRRPKLADKTGNNARDKDWTDATGSKTL